MQHEQASTGQSCWTLLTQAPASSWLATQQTASRKVNAMALTASASWRKDKGSSAERGYGYRWQQARAAYLAEHPLCVMCEAAGRITIATVVDHSVPHKGDTEIFWDRSRWQSLCKQHHDSDAQRRDKGSKQQTKFGSDGRVVW